MKGGTDMEKNFVFDEELDLNDELNELEDVQDSYSNFRDESDCLTESDFYPPSDNRVWTSNVEDIDGGDNFADYCKYIFKTLEEEKYFNN